VDRPGQRVVSARGDLQDLGAKQRFGFDLRFGPVAEVDVVGDVEPISTLPPARVIEDTVPTFRPAPCTSPPVIKPLASEKYAEYCLLPLRNGILL